MSTTSTVTLSGRLALTLDNGAYIDLGEVEVPITVNVGHPLRPPFGYAPGVRGRRAAEAEEAPDVEPDHDRDAPPTDTDGGVRLNKAPVEDVRAYAKARQAGENPAVARAAIRANVTRTIRADAIHADVARTVREGARRRGDAR